MTRSYQLTSLIKGYAYTPFYEYPSHIGGNISDALARWIAFQVCAHASCNTRLERKEGAPLFTDLSVWVRKEWEKHGQEYIELTYAGVKESKSRFFHANVKITGDASQRLFQMSFSDKTLIHHFDIKGVKVMVGNKRIYIQDQLLPQPLIKSLEDLPESWPVRGIN